MHVFIYIDMCIYVSLYVCMYVCVRVRMYVYIYVCKFLCMYVSKGSVQYSVKDDDYKRMNIVVVALIAADSL